MKRLMTAARITLDLLIGALLLVATLTLPVIAQETDSGSGLTAQEVIDDPEAALATLSDREVRSLLLEQLEAQQKSSVSQFNPADFAFAVQNGFGVISERAGEVFGAAPLLPDVFTESFRRIVGESAPGEFGAFILIFLLSLALAGFAEWMVRRRLRRVGVYDFADREGLVGQLGVLAWRLMVSTAHILFFAAVAAAVYFALGDENPSFRATFVFYLVATLITRMALAAADAFFSPDRPGVRIARYSDAQALRLKRTLVFTVACGAFGFFTCSLFAVHGVVGHAHELVLILTGTITIAALMASIMINRDAISADLLAVGTEPTQMRRISASLWPPAQAILVLIMWIGVVASAFLGMTPLYGAALTTIFLFLVAPSFEAALEREAVRATQDERDMTAALYRSGRLAVALTVLIVLTIAWRVNLLMAGEGSIASLVATAGLQIAGTLTVAYLLWNAVHVWIERKIREEELEHARQAGVDPSEMEIGGTGQSRLRTLLPLVKRTFQITLGVITGMVLMSSLGIDIAPVLAGAGVVGLAIGFGSQTLVRDVVSGVFFLVDDAFRLGEYVDVGDVKGSVERISIRSFQLRHHRGAVNTVPFGEIKVLRNYSRDWAIMKLRFRVSFDADLEKVRKIMKRVGQELLEHPDIGEDFLQPFKSQGVLEVDDYGFIVRAKFMSKPGKQFLIRRYAYMAVQKAFAENGIDFAKPEVRVVVEDDDEDEETGLRLGTNRELAGGAAAKITTAQKLQEPEPSAAQ